MIRRPFRALSLFTLLAAAACGGGDAEEDPLTPGVDAGAEVGQKGITAVSCSSATPAVTVTTPGNFFQPANNTIQRGDVVRFDPSSGHDVFSNEAGLFSVPLAGEGCFRFDEAGTFNFRCRPHGFEGRIVVQ